MMIPILQMQKVRLREAQKLSKLWQMAKLTLTPSRSRLPEGYVHSCVGGCTRLLLG